jgi:uncharacterized protein (DUF3084 family)
MDRTSQSLRNRAATLRTRSQELRRVAAARTKVGAEMQKATGERTEVEQKDAANSPSKPEER